MRHVGAFFFCTFIGYKCNVFPDTDKVSPNIIMLYLSTEVVSHNIGILCPMTYCRESLLQTIRDHRCNPRLPYLAKFSITFNGENKIVHGKTRIKQYVHTNPDLQKVLEEKPQPKEANFIHKNTGNR